MPLNLTLIDPASTRGDSFSDIHRVINPFMTGKHANRRLPCRASSKTKSKGQN